MSFKPSMYNYEIEREDGSKVVRNLLWGNAVTLSADDFVRYKAVVVEGQSDPLLEERLRAGRFLIESDFDELQYMRQRSKASRLSSMVLGLTIAPTIDCNLACPYCYEDKRPGAMSAAVENALIKYVEENLPGRRRLRVTWYGGEPLMGRESIYRLMSEFLACAERSECEFSARMTTNGFLLTPGVVDRLAHFPVWESIQVTLDGDEKEHDVRRPSKTGKGTFSTIYKNLLYAADHLPVTVRMNIDRFNAESCESLLSRLSQAVRPDRLKVYFSPVHPYGEGCRDIADGGSSILDNSQFSKVEQGLRFYAKALGFRTADPLPKNTCQSCQAVTTHSVVIEPDGTLQRCWTEVGQREKSVGSLFTGITINGPNSVRWLAYDPTAQDPCRTCGVLPLCFGGCPQRHLDGRPIDMICSSIRYELLSELAEQYGGHAREPLRSKRQSRTIRIHPYEAR